MLVPDGAPCCDIREVPRQETGDIWHMLEMRCCEHEVDKICMEEVFVALAQIRDETTRKGGSSQEVSKKIGPLRICLSSAPSQHMAVATP